MSRRILPLCVVLVLLLVQGAAPAFAAGMQGSMLHAQTAAVAQQDHTHCHSDNEAAQDAVEAQAAASSCCDGDCPCPEACASHAACVSTRLVANTLARALEDHGALYRAPSDAHLIALLRPPSPAA